MLSALLPLALLVQFGDEVAIVKNAPGKSSKMELWVHTPLGFDLPPLAYASDVSFYKANGKRPVRAVFGADVDGDVVDEVVVLREELDRGGRYRLFVHHAPKALGGSAGKVIASTKKNDLGTAATKGAIVASCAVDVDGDGIDEVALVRQVADGTQRLEVFPLPKKKNQPLGEPTGSYLEFGVDPFDAAVSMDGFDMNADGAEEILVQRRSATWFGHRMAIVRAPLVVDDLVETPLAEAVDPNPLDGEVLAVRSVDLDSNGVDEIGLVRRMIESDGSIMRVHGLPVLGNLPFPIAGMNLGPAKDLHSTFALRGLSSKGNQSEFDSGVLKGDFAISMNHVEVFGYLGGNSDSFTAEGTGKLVGQDFQLDFGNDGPTLQGPLDLLGMAVGFTPSVGVNVKGKGGDALTLGFYPAKVLWLGSKVIVTGNYAGFGHATDGSSFSVQNGKYQFTRKID